MRRVPAWVMHSTGAPDVLQLGTIQLPVPAAGQVLIKVVAAGFNPVDTKIRAGLAPIAPDSGVLGVDVSGVVEEVGPDVEHLQPGDNVYGCAGGVRGHGGALAQYMLADARLLAIAPKVLPLSQSAGLPVPALTARELVRRLALKDGDELAVLGASGAVGRMLTRFARMTGCRVVGTAGSEDRLQLIRSAGAQAFLHHEITQQPRSFTKVADTFGGPALKQALQLASAGGQVATINARGQHELGVAHAKALTLHAIFILLPLLNGIGREWMSSELQCLTDEIDQGLVDGLNADELPMSSVAEVHSRYEQGLLQQKTVLLADF